MTAADKIPRAGTAARARIPFALPDVGEAEVAEVTDAIRSGWITTGPRAHAFEAEFADAVGADHALAVNSATSGLHLALEASGVGEGDAVVMPTVTFAACAEVARYLGADPILADVDPATGLATPEHFASAAAAAAEGGQRVAALMPVHFAGQACDMDGMASVAARYRARIVGDAAHAFPTTYQGHNVAVLGDFAVFSFYATKTLTTGEGGMVTSTDPDAVARMKTMRLHGISTDAWDRYNRERPGWHYEVIAPGFKYNMPDIAAAMGLAQLRRSNEMWEQRRRIAAVYRDAFGGTALRPLRVVRPDDTHAWHLFVVRLADDAPVDRAGFMDKLADAGIGTSVHFIPLHHMPYYRDRYRLTPDMFPGAENYFRSCVSLPVYSAMIGRDVERVIVAARDAIDG